MSFDGFTFVALRFASHFKIPERTKTDIFQFFSIN